MRYAEPESRGRSEERSCFAAGALVSKVGPKAGMRNPIELWMEARIGRDQMGDVAVQPLSSTVALDQLEEMKSEPTKIQQAEGGAVGQTGRVRNEPGRKTMVQREAKR